MIERVTIETLEEILPLIEKYQQFYNVHDISTARNRAFFTQFCGDSDKGAQFLYRENGSVIGFATVYFSYASTITAKVAVLNDLFVESGYRTQGYGRALIEHCLDFGRAAGAARLQWLTAKDNVNAQAAYDKLGAKRSDWVFYSYVG